ncbi:hypothetical protein C5689_06095 [Methylosinus sporium]|uniref:Uncharacterized protein n=1 Tax=Methylosinus sporium TaxID=428 RepID=A0A2U1SSN9_METSR|nr:hypothetical protein C5689_06095 [Methylosinus sporium]
MTTPDAKRLADKYCSSDGGPPDSGSEAPQTSAERAWRDYAESVHRVLRKSSIAKTEDGRLALFGFERIGDAIAEDEKRARNRR